MQSRNITDELTCTERSAKRAVEVSGGAGVMQRIVDPYLTRIAHHHNELLTCD